MSAVEQSPARRNATIQVPRVWVWWAIWAIAPPAIVAMLRAAGVTP